MTLPTLADLRRWFDSSTPERCDESRGEAEIEWMRVLPFFLMHVGCAAVLVVDVSTVAVSVAILLYALRMFAITAFYHRYFSHRAFRTSRAVQFAMAVLGASAAQRGPLWWAAHHRHHHAHADQARDRHSPRQHGFLWSHVGWFLARGAFATRNERVPDLARYPELRWLDRFDVVVPAVLGLTLYASGEWLRIRRPELGTSGAQLFVWGFCISTVVLYHATFAINSLAHRHGSRRFDTRDDSRNSFWLALLTFGEGWHNNHHRFPGAARQGLRWYEIDVTYLGLITLEFLGVIRDLRPCPAMSHGNVRQRPELPEP